MSAHSIGSYSRRRFIGTSTPTFTLGLKTTPSASISATRRSRMRFSILNSGMPYRSRPPMRSDFSKTVTR